MKVLIVEDEVIIAYDLQRRMERHGYHVVSVVATAEDAIAKADQFRPDVILMDVMLQGPHDGIYAAGQIQSMYAIPIVFLSGNTSMMNDERLKSLKRYAMICKPCTDGDILGIIENIMR
jgi:CheY-like chemotaxis protein